MKIFLIIITILTLNAKEFRNELQHETSPYLLQHKNNPVNWMAWNTKAFERAKKENKPIFLSIGYSTCHWCHVMKEESFTNEKLAKLFNKYFVCIKVDREEMSHIDSLYQEAYLKVNNHSGGWPLSVFMTPNKEIYYIGTYLPPQKESYSEGFNTLLPRLGGAYQRNDKNFQTKLKEIQKTISEPVKYLKVIDEDISVKTLSKSLKKSYDDIYSGFGEGRKFPEASKLSLMMDLARISNDEELQDYSYEMLDTMALKGLYDHIEGGFFRYTVDAAWEIPHFEKMLYNQAELIPLYIRAYVQTGKKLYKSIVTETISMLDGRYVQNDLYFSASDADTNHHEGEYFTFTPQEISKTKFNFDANFEGRIHINFYEQQRPKGYAGLKKELLRARATKEYPFIDKKINTAWNSMMIEALFKAALLDDKYAEKANKTLSALSEFVFNKGELYHQGILGSMPKQKGLLEDYSFFISALIAGYEYDYNDEKLDFAEYLLNKALRKFYQNGVWHLSDDNLHIKAGIKDKYYTSALSKMALNLVKLASLKSSFKYEKILNATLDNLNSELLAKQSEAPALAQAFLMQKLKVVTIKSSKKNLLKNANSIKKIKYPYVLSKKSDYDDFLACTIRRCFSKDSKLEVVKKVIDSDLLK